MVTTPSRWDGAFCITCGRPTRYSVGDVYQCKGGCRSRPAAAKEEDVSEEMVIDAAIVDNLINELDATLEVEPEPEPAAETEPAPPILEPERVVVTVTDEDIKAATPRRRRTRKRAT